MPWMLVDISLIYDCSVYNGIVLSSASIYLFVEGRGSNCQSAAAIYRYIFIFFRELFQRAVLVYFVPSGFAVI